MLVGFVASWETGWLEWGVLLSIIITHIMLLTGILVVCLAGFWVWLGLVWFLSQAQAGRTDGFPLLVAFYILSFVHFLGKFIIITYTYVSFGWDELECQSRKSRGPAGERA